MPLAVEVCQIAAELDPLAAHPKPSTAKERQGTIGRARNEVVGPLAHRAGRECALNEPNLVGPLRRRSAVSGLARSRTPVPRTAAERQGAEESEPSSRHYLHYDTLRHHDPSRSPSRSWPTASPSTRGCSSARDRTGAVRSRWSAPPTSRPATAERAPGRRRPWRPEHRRHAPRRQHRRRRQPPSPRRWVAAGSAGRA